MCLLFFAYCCDLSLAVLRALLGATLNSKWSTLIPVTDEERRESLLLLQGILLYFESSRRTMLENNGMWVRVFFVQTSIALICCYYKILMEQQLPNPSPEVKSAVLSAILALLIDSPVAQMVLVPPLRVS